VTHISASTASRMLHHEGLQAMHMIKKPLLTREHKRKRLEFARTHRDWTVDQFAALSNHDVFWPILASFSCVHG
ncbi:hypothetical protein EON65_51450, partial [archaeon]